MVFGASWGKGGEGRAGSAGLGAPMMGRKRMSFDITKQINDWPYEPGQINVRLIAGDDADLG